MTGLRLSARAELGQALGLGFAVLTWAEPGGWSTQQLHGWGGGNMTPPGICDGGGRPPCLGCCEITRIQCLGAQAQRSPGSVQPYGSCLSLGRSARRRVACVWRGNRKGALQALRTPQQPPALPSG